ncbi:MAG: hypothetical protein LW625_05825 [Planctomycetaceae bacterium]|nr:hypothetical protein [Planctomycetaceae bacterium]
MGEPDPLRVPAERCVAHGEGLGFSNNAISQMDRVANDRETKMPEMNADLIGATGQAACKEQVVARAHAGRASYRASLLGDAPNGSRRQPDR